MTAARALLLYVVVAAQDTTAVANVPNQRHRVVRTLPCIPTETPPLPGSCIPVGGCSSKRTLRSASHPTYPSHRQSSHLSRRARQRRAQQLLQLGACSPAALAAQS